MSPKKLRQRPKEVRSAEVTGPLRGLGQIPDSPLKDTYKWADYVELRCCASADYEVTIGDLAGWLRVDPAESPDLAESSEEPAADFHVSQEEDRPEPASGGAEGDSDESSGEAARSVDNRQRLSEDVFKLLRYRKQLHGAAYPFTLTAANDKLQLQESALPDSARVYLFLLLCSAGRYVRQHGQLTKDFERLCVPALKALVPTADVHVFGTADRQESAYTGNFKSKVSVLAEKVGERTQDAVTDIGEDEYGDRGLDVAAVVGMGDDLGGKLAVFAQAACTDEWVTKQDSPSSEAWDQIILLTTPAVVACCIPHCFRNAKGKWHDRSKIHRRLLLDRRRLIYLLREQSEAVLASLVTGRGVVEEVLVVQYAA